MAFADYKSALVTGATGGIGAGILRRLRAEGLEVHAVARNGKALNSLASGCGAIPHVLDIGSPEAIETLVASLRVDILVNNAGVSHGGNLSARGRFEIDSQVDVNLRAPMHFIRLLLPGMIERRRGHIVNISSVAAEYPYEGHAAYHATKAGLHMLSRQVRQECFGSPVRVTEISPGRVETGIFAKTQNLDPEDAARRFFEGYRVLSPDDIADAVAYVVGAPEHVNIGHIEITPTMQVPGGLRIAKWPDA